MFFKMFGGGLLFFVVVISDMLEQDCYDKGFISVMFYVFDLLFVEVGVMVLFILVEEKMQECVQKMGNYLKRGFEELQECYECIGDVRGRGLLLGMEIVKDWVFKMLDFELGSKIVE